MRELVAHMKKLRAAGLYRELLLADGLDFASNDYLGIAGGARAQSVLESARSAAEAQGIAHGSGGSRLLRGHAQAHLLLEEKAARLFGAPSALYMANGYAANLSLLATLPKEGDVVFHDEAVHASMYDGMRLNKAQGRAFRHNDANHLEDRIRRLGPGTMHGAAMRPARRLWIAVESLYSMDGDIAPLADLLSIAQHHDACLIVDEAHAGFVFGARGQGLLPAAARSNAQVITLHTFGKAMGSEGAVLCAEREVIQYLINCARPFIYSTAPSPMVAALNAALIDFCAQAHGLRRALAARIQHFTQEAASLGIACAMPGPIQPLILGPSEKAVRFALKLRQRGFDVRAVRPPSVARNTARLRISLTLNSTAEDASALLGEIAKLQRNHA